MLRCVLCGRVSAGKSSLLYALRHGTAAAHGSDATIGVAYMRWRNMDIWDTAGQEQYRALMALYFRRLHAALVIFDLTCRVSFEETNYWTSEVRKHSPNAQILLVGCKADLDAARRVSHGECMEKADELRAQYWETSARSGAGVEAPLRCSRDRGEARAPGRNWSWTGKTRRRGAGGGAAAGAAGRREGERAAYTTGTMAPP